jgi:serine/threonine protein phosphatase PrpC
MDPNDQEDTAEFLTSTPEADLPTPRPRGTSVEVDLAALSHPGRVRPNNEDHYLVLRAGRYLRTWMTNLPEGCVPHEFEETVYGMAVADGMGGRAAGEVASQLALARLIELVIDTPDWIFSHDEPKMVEILNRAALRFRTVNAALLERARREPRLAGMGTTLTAARSFGPDLTVVHVGDSRVYLLRRGVLHRLTRDHTLAQELADLGKLPAEDVATHGLRHVLTQAIGLWEAGGEPEVRRLRLADGDRLLLCTDGLTEMVDDATIAAEMGRDRSAAEVCQALLDLALVRGGLDNVTIVVAGYRIPEGP